MVYTFAGNAPNLLPIFKSAADIGKG